jgi:hypothetical protein
MRAFLRPKTEALNASAPTISRDDESHEVASNDLGRNAAVEEERTHCEGCVGAALIEIYRRY